MKSPGLLTRLDDLLNPIVVKELRQAVKSRLIVFALLLFLALQMLILGLFLYWPTRDVGRQPGELDFQAGRQVFVFLHSILLGTCMLLIPAYAGTRLGLERSDANVDLLFISTLRPRSIIAGKFFAAFVLTLMIFSACAPFLTFTYLLRGLDIPTILLVLATDLLSVMAGTLFAVFLATIPGHWVFRVLLGLAGFGLLMLLMGGELTAWGEALSFGVYVPLDSWEFWAPALGILAGVLGIMGLFFTWSVALVSPTSANRALPVRVYMAAQWLITGVAAALWSRQSPHMGPVWSWTILQGILFGLQLVIAINEREQWSSRVARRIPRSQPLRLLAFLFYSGSGGGLTFGALFFGLSIVAVPLWELWNPGMPGAREADVVLETLLVAGLYTFCYAVLAVLVRAYLCAGRVRVGHTWILWLTLVGMGSALPYIIDFIVYYNDYNYRSGEIDVWLLPSPFAATLDVAYSHRHNWSRAFESRGLVFGAVWAAVMVLAAVPWYVGQLRRFHPPAPPLSTGGRKPPERSLAGPAASPNQDIHAPRSPTEISR